jgi:hypothetical protein
MNSGQLRLGSHQCGWWICRVPTRAGSGRRPPWGEQWTIPKDGKTAIDYANRVIPIFKWGTRAFVILGVLMIVVGLSVTKEAGNVIGGVLVLVSPAMFRIYWMRFRRSVRINEGVDKP